MAKTAEATINVSTLKVADQYVLDIIDTAAHVALYNYNLASSEWEKTEVEGALFLYSRSCDPKYNIFILNRLSTYSLMEPITDELELQLKDPFLLYRNRDGQINGIWFLDPDECVRIAKRVEKLVKDVSPKKGNLNVALKSCSSGKQPENSSKSPNYSGAKKKVVSNPPNETSKRVMDFFAKARDKAPSQPPGAFSVPPQPILPSYSLPAENPLPDVPLLQRLMSNPVKTVEQIEKQQRAVTPQSLPERAIYIKEVESHAQSMPITINSNGLKEDPKNHGDLANGFSYLGLSESPSQGFTPTGFINTHHFFNSAVINSPKVSEAVEVSVLERSVTASAAKQPSLETPPKPALIPPVVFAESASSFRELNLTKPEPVISVKPEPLTKSQLLQAVSYLLKNDADFVNKLHEAYVKSFVDMVS